MAITYRRVKGSNLTPDEVDDNFLDLSTNKVDKVSGKQLSTEDYTSTEKTKLSGVATGATANNTDAFLVARGNHTGTESADVLTDGTTNKAYTATERTKLSGVASGATANQTDTYLLDRANHTGTQSADTIINGTTNKVLTASEKTNVGNIPTLTAQVAAISPTIQTETAAYIQRIIAAGSSIDAFTINAIDEFVVRGKAEGWYTSILNFAPILGGSLAGALVKLVTEPGGASSMVATNLVAADYNPRYGFRILTNSLAIGKYVNTGLSPDALGLTTTGIGLGLFVTEDSTSATESFIMGNNGVPGSTPAQFDKIQATVNLGRLTISNVSYNVAVGGNRMQFININGANNFQGYKNGIRTNDSTATALTATALTEPITLFRGIGGSAFVWGVGSIGSFILTQPLTSVRASQLTKAIYNLYIRTGRVQTQGSNIEWDGDSITAGQGVTLPSDRFSNIVTAYIGGNMFNLGIPSGRTNLAGGNNAAAPVPLTLTALDVDIPINTSIITMGVNDELATGDVTSQGYQASLESIIQYKKDKGQRVILNSPTYLSSETSGTLVTPLARQRTYLLAAANAAANKSVPFVNLLDAFLDLDNPLSYTTDGVHYNAAGHKIIAARIIAVLQGQIFRTPKLDFPSIAAGAYSDLTVDYMYGARTNMNVMVGQPVTPVVGLTYQAFVSANDVVTVRAINNTASAIDAALQVLKITVIL